MTERELWLENPLAFWLDPDRWYGVPPGECFWMHLDKRPAPPAPDLLRFQPGAIQHVKGHALEMLRRANDAEDVGELDVATILRRQAVWRLRGR